MAFYTSERALVFDIKEFSVNDGPGARVTVFLKGCPLHCMWCHNPEGLSYENQINKSTGKPYARYYTTSELSEYLLKFNEFFTISNGGVTFSGGEATLHSDFLVQVLKKLRSHGIHCAIQTSGYCDSDVFMQLVNNLDLVMYDLKIMECKAHQKFIGVDNSLIKKNALFLAKSGCHYIVRCPMIPSITDTKKNLEGIYKFVISLPQKPDCIEFLNYNSLAPAKYENLGMKYRLNLKSTICNSDLIESYVQKFNANGFDSIFRRK